MPSAPKESALQIRALEKTYSNGFRALEGIDLDIPRGSFYALLWPNGAGKSTTIGIVTGIVNLTSGSVRVFGNDIKTHSAECKSKIGVVAQEFNFGIFETVLEIVINQAGYYGISRSEAMPKAERRLKELLLWDKRNDQSRTLSGGMKRRLMIARALIHEPEILILDEPTAGVDVELRRGMWDFLRELNASGTTIVLTTHYLEEAELLCDRVAIINEGKIVRDGTMKEVLKGIDEETYVLETATGESIEIVSDRKTPIGSAIASLEKNGEKIVSLRNKSNRLEELFVRLTRKSGAKTNSLSK